MAYLRAQYETDALAMRGLTHSSRLANASALVMFTDRVPDRPEWHASAACGRNGVLGDDPKVRVKIMFPARGEDSTRARKVCDQCPVSDQCRSANEQVELRHARDVGVWYGTSGNMRRDKPPVVKCPCGERFTRTKPGQTYCGEECREEARRESNRRYQQGVRR